MDCRSSSSLSRSGCKSRLLTPPHRHELVPPLPPSLPPNPTGDLFPRLTPGHTSCVCVSPLEIFCLQDEASINAATAAGLQLLQSFSAVACLQLCLTTRRHSARRPSLSSSFLGDNPIISNLNSAAIYCFRLWIHLRLTMYILPTHHHLDHHYSLSHTQSHRHPEERRPTP